MKDFSSYARQIAEELMLKNPEHTNKKADKCLHGYVLSNGRGAGFVFRPEKDVDYYGIVSAANELWDGIEGCFVELLMNIKAMPQITYFEDEFNDFLEKEFGLQITYNDGTVIMLERKEVHNED